MRNVLLVTPLMLGLIALGSAFSPSPLLTGLLLGVLLCSGYALFRPAFTLILLVLCTALPALTLPLPGHNIHLVELAVILCLCVLLLQRPQVNLSLPHLCMLLFLFIAFLSFVHVPEFTSGDTPYGAHKRLIAWLLTVLVFCAATLLSQYIARVTTFLLLLLLACIPVYLVAAGQAFQVPWLNWLAFADAQNSLLTQGRLWGPFPWSVNFGMYLINVLAIALGCWLLAPKGWQRIAGCVMALLTLLTLIGTGTRSALLAALLMMLGAFVVTRHIRTLITTVLVSAIAAGFTWQQFLPLFIHDDSSTSNRILIWQTALQLISHNPVWGIGLQQFHRYYEQLLVSKANELGAMGIHPHQQYLEWALEGGLPWLLAGLLVLCSILYRCMQAYRSSCMEHKPVLLAAMLAVSGNMLMGFFDAPLDQLEGCMLLFLVCGLALGYTRSAQPAREPDKIIDAAMPLSASHTDMPRTGQTIVLQILSWGIALPLIFPMTALLTRYLGPEQYGLYSLTFPFLTIFSLLSGSGMDPVLIRQLSQQAQECWGETLSYAAGSRLLATLMSSGVAMGAACVLPVSEAQKGLLLLGSCSLLFSFSFNGLRMIYTLGFRAEQRIGQLALLETGNRLLTAGLVALVVYWRLPLFWAYGLLIFSDLPACYLLVRLASKRYGIRFRFHARLFREHMLSGLPVVGHTLLTVIGGQIDLFLLAFMVGAWPTGLYALASRIIDPLISIALAYVNGLYPLFCRTQAERPEEFGHLYYQALRVLLISLLPLGIVLTFEASTIVLLLGGAPFLEASGAVKLLGWTMVMTFLNQLGERACMALQNERGLLVVTGVATSINVLANLLFIPQWGLLGASGAALLSECIALVCLHILLSRHFLQRMVGMCLVRILPCCLLLCVCYLSWLLMLPPLLRLVLVPTLILFCYVGTGADVVVVKRVFRRRKWYLADCPTLIMPRVNP